MTKKILIVEDVIEIAENIKKYLQDFGYEVSGIISFGEDAVDLVAVSKPDLILMDIDLAGEMDGLEAAERINRKYGIPIVFVTANDNENAIERASSTEPFGYILKPFTERELRVILEMAFYKQRISQAQKEFTHKIEQLHHTALAMSTIDSEENIFRLTIENMIELIDFKYFSFYIKHKNKLLSLETTLNKINKKYIDDDFTYALARKVKALNQNIIFGRIDSLSGFFIKKHSLISSGICLAVNNSGVIELFSNIPDHYNLQDFKVSGLLINHTKEALKRLRLQRELQMQAIHDPLTKAYNRFYLYKQFEMIKSNSKYSNQSIAFMMIDVNNLKYINDHFGHQIGDEVLTTVANVLLSASRPDDTVVRYGGDEFLVMLPNTGEEVIKIKYRILAEMEKWNQDHNKFRFEISFAIGTAYWEKNKKQDLDEVLTKADESMYRHKREIKKKFKKNFLFGKR